MIISNRSTIYYAFSQLKNSQIGSIFTISLKSLIVNSAERGFGIPYLNHECMICLCKFELSTVSPSIIPRVPIPAPARYNAAGDPRPPVPTIRTRVDLSLSYPSTPTSGMMSWRVYLIYSSLSSNCSIII